MNDRSFWLDTKAKRWGGKKDILILCDDQKHICQFFDDSSEKFYIGIIDTKNNTQMQRKIDKIALLLFGGFDENDKFIQGIFKKHNTLWMPFTFDDCMECGIMPYEIIIEDVDNWHYDPHFKFKLDD
jgi:hypothetical protein